MADNDDLKSHQEMWRNFVRLLAFAAASAVSIALLAILLL